MLFELTLPAPVRAQLSDVNAHIEHICASPYPTIDAVLRYAISASGKRLRALLVIVLLRVLQQGKTTKQPILLASAVELMHLATLLHDDVIDAAQTRRGKQSVHVKWSGKESILAGDLLYTNAFEQIVQLASHQLNQAFTETTKRLITGELLQAHLTWQDADSLEQKKTRYFEVIDHKTAGLFAFCARAAATIAGESEQRISMWGHYAQCLGMAFQIIDDVLDFTSSKSGKQRGTDLQEGKVTLPLLFGLNGLSAEQQQALIAGAELDVAAVTSALDAADAFNKAKNCARAYCTKANDILTTLGDVTAHSDAALLRAIPDLIVEREK